MTFNVNTDVHYNSEGGLSKVVIHTCLPSFSWQQCNVYVTNSVFPKTWLTNSAKWCYYKVTCYVVPTRVNIVMV